MKIEFIFKGKVALGFFSRKNAVLILFALSFFDFCKSSHETFVEEIQELVEQEKYEKASEKLKEKLQSPREKDEFLSTEVPDSARIIEFSNDRLKLVWTEDQKIFFRILLRGIITPEVWIRFLPTFHFLKMRITLWWSIRCKLPAVADTLRSL